MIQTGHVAHPRETRSSYIISGATSEGTKKPPKRGVDSIKK
jgi:hypothetical protein